jgi:acyl carrier protein
MDKLGEITTVIMDVIRENHLAPGVEITADSSLTNDLGLDSLDTVELTLQLEDKFETAIDEDKVASTDTPVAIATYIIKVMNGRGLQWKT